MRILRLFSPFSPDGFSEKRRARTQTFREKTPLKTKRRQARKAAKKQANKRKKSGYKSINTRFRFYTPFLARRKIHRFDKRIAEKRRRIFCRSRRKCKPPRNRRRQKNKSFPQFHPSAKNENAAALNFDELSAKQKCPPSIKTRRDPFISLRSFFCE